MVLLKDLKENILANDIKNFYIFYGPDYGIRKHYIDKIAESFSSKRIIYDYKDLQESQSGSGLFKMDTLFIVPNDENILKLNKNQIETFIRRIGTDCVILDYEDDISSSILFKEFENYMTYFPLVESNIAYEFIDSEVSLLNDSKKELARNCRNNYNSICLESDKIRNYAQAKNISQEAAYKSLYTKEQMLYEYPDFKTDQLVDSILTGHHKDLLFWKEMIENKYSDLFWMSYGRIMSDYMIAYLVQSLGKYPGGNQAYDLNLPWGRIKQIRELNIIYDAEYLLDAIYRLCNLDFLIKTGQVSSENAFNYFLSVVI